MKIAFVGSSDIIDNPSIRSLLEAEFERLTPSLVILVPNQKFNMFIRSLAEKRGIPVDEMNPPKPTWLGHGKFSARKGKCRSLYGYYISRRAEKIVCFGKMGAVGASYRPIVEYARGSIPTQELEFSV